MTWPEETRQKAQSLLSKRIELGSEISHMFEIELMQNELALLGKIDAQSTLFIMTINEALANNNSSLQDFETAFENRVNFHNETWTYDLYFPLYLNLPKRVMIINGVTITKVSVKKLYRLFPKENLIPAIRANAASAFTLENMPDHALHFSVTGNNKLEAWKKVSAQFELLRGIIDFSTLFNNINYTFGSASRTKNDHPQWGLLNNVQKNTFEFISFRVAKAPKIKSIVWSKKSKARFEALLLSSKSKPYPNESRYILADCLRLYSQSMESVYLHNCFLSLWQIAEALTRSETSGGQTKNVLSRITWHSSSYSMIRNLDISKSIDELAKKRNDIVHRGIDQVQNSDINLIKSLCDTGIKWLLDKHTKLKTVTHLDEFYRLRTSNDNFRKCVIETIKIL